MIKPLLALAALVAASPALAQSFDCGKATTSVERLVCSDARLSALDAELGAKVKKSLSADLPHRIERLEEARKWLAERDRLCPLPAGDLADAARATALACLVSAYGARLAAIRTAPAPALAGGLCRALAEHYRALLARRPDAPFEKSFEPASPLDLLARDPDSGVAIAPPLAEIDEFSGKKLAEWAKRQTPPFALPGVLVADLDAATRSRARIERLPGANFHAVSAVEGTMHCYSSAYFAVDGASARRIHGPPAWEGEAGEGCGTARSFGVLDGAPVAFEETHDFTPSLESSVSVSPWRGKGFGPACTATFRFAPRFSTRASSNEWEQRCEGAECDALRAAALALVESAQADPLGARRTALARLTDAQRRRFGELEALAGLGTAEPRHADAAEYLDSDPLRLPLVVGERLNLAELGHHTIGWRAFSDWRVTLKQPEAGALKERAVIAIGMTKGELRDASVK